MKHGITWNMKYKKLLAIIAICSLVLCGCDNGGGGGGGTDIPTGDDPDDTKTEVTEPGIVEPDDNPDDPDSGSGGDGGDNNPDDPDSGSGGDGGNTGGTSNPDPVDPDHSFYQTYYHEWADKDDFGVSNNALSAGTTKDINGLKWSYNDLKILYYQSGLGLQIGSSNNPASGSGWTLSTDFGESVVLSDLSIIIGNGSGGSGTYTIKAGSETVSTSSFSHSNAIATYTFDDIDITTTSLSINFTANSKAMYFYSISFTVLTSEDTKLSLSEDSYVGEAVVPGENNVPATKYTSLGDDYASYYSGVNLNATGDTLKNELYSKISTMDTYSYGDARYALTYTDELPENPGYLLSIYDGDYLKAEWGSSWNREHVWPQSLLPESSSLGDNTKDSRSDLHELRASCKTANSYRGDKYFDNTQTSSTCMPNLTSNEINGIHSFTGEFRGEVARTCFYMYVRYNSTLGITLSNSPSGDSQMGILDTLVEWSNTYQPTEFEKQRNDRIYQYQGNRNPFVDYPDLVNQLFS